MSDHSASKTDTPDVPQLVSDISEKLRLTAEEVVPWFVSQMPSAYFQDTDRAKRLTHLSAVIGARASGLPLRLTLKTQDSTEWTFIHEASYPGVLARVLRQLPRDRPLGSAKVHTAADEKLVLDVFRFREALVPFDASDPRQRQGRDAALECAQSQGGTTVSALKQHIERCPASYVRSVAPRRIYENFTLCEAVRQSDDVAIRLADATEGPGFRRFSLATRSSAPRALFERVVAHLGRYALNIHRAYLDLFDSAAETTIAVMGFVVYAPEFMRQAPDHPIWRELNRDLLRLKWVGEQALELVDRDRGVDLLRAEIITGLCNLVHAVLGREDSHAFSRARLSMLVKAHLETAAQVAELFQQRFDPNGPLDDPAFTALIDSLKRDIDRAAEGDAHTQRFFEHMVDAVVATLRTNAFVEQRYGLALRIDPAWLTRSDHPERPYGVFFVHGRGFDGFHVRFRDIARGGVRVVRTLGAGEHGRESVRLYDEAYQLAFAQQLKNKDIPEGGSKAVMLAEPGTPVEASVKSFVDSLLDLLSPDPALRANVVDLWGREEWLYLGPDENISSELIEWIVDRARQRGYTMPGAFMSSKPGAGINHKEYGVTSEGVTVFLEEALRYVGIDPRQQDFTVKITGGPDGDVAGNEIKILQREFGDHARIVGIADGSGSAEDPDGLDTEELLRLVERAAPIASFDRTLLGSRGRVTPLDAADGRRLRNTLHSRVAADAFVPAGGRPATIDHGNWHEFLHDGRPSSRVIVEGANLFITPQAREQLSRKGVIIVKDSSANKCGVICSSFEIVASMLLGPDEFLDIKERFVAEVLDKLRDLARREARLLFREHRHDPGTLLPELSVQLSRAILRATDAIEHALGDLEGGDELLMHSLVEDHLPAVLMERAEDRIRQRIPLSYINGIIASSLAARIVYREGLHYLASASPDDLARIAVRYLRQERETAQLIAEVEASQLPNRGRIVALLRQGGPRAGVTIAHQDK